MNVPGLARVVFLGEQPEDASIAAACVVSLLVNGDFLSLEFAVFPLREYQQVGFQKHTHLLYPPATEITECLPLGSVGGKLIPYRALLKIPLFNEEKKGC